MPRTLDGLTVGDFDEIIVNDDLTVKGSTTLSGMNLDGSLTATAINASGDVATTGDVSGADITASGTVSGTTITASGEVSGASLTASGAVSGASLTASGTVSGTTITASGNVSGVDISASGDMTCDGLTTTGNSTLGNAIGDLQTINGVVNINGQYAFADDAFNGSNMTLSSSLNVGSGELIVSNAASTATFGASTIFGGEVSMSSGGVEVFNYNDHGLTNVGSIAMTTGGDITNCDEITCDTLHLNTALNMDGVSLDLGDGSLTSNGGINTTGSTSCRAINTTNSNVTMGTGDLTCDDITAGDVYASSLGGVGAGGVITITYANLLNTTNLTIPSNVYDNAGQWIMTFDAGIFHPNDDSSYYNYCLDDDVLKTYGRGHVRSSSLEVLGVIQIPRGWTATGTFLDIRDSSGNVITSSPPTYHAWRIYTYQSGGTIPDAYPLYTLGSRGINTENAFSGGETVVGAAGTALFLDINITSTSQFIGGGYVLLNAPS